MYHFTSNFAHLSNTLGDNIIRDTIDVVVANLPFIGSEEERFKVTRDFCLDKYVNPNRELIEACGLPVVLNIKLQTECSYPGRRELHSGGHRTG